MWPFKKNKKPAQTSEPIVNSILCIPGLWPSIDELTNTVFASNNGEWMIVGDIMFNPKTQHHYNIKITGHDESMRESFRVAGSITRIPEECLDKIQKNTFVVYISCKTGNLPDAYQLASQGLQSLRPADWVFGLKQPAKLLINKNGFSTLKTSRRPTFLKCL